MQAIDPMLKVPQAHLTFSPAFTEILRFCSQIHDPSSHDLKALSAIYRCVRPEMNDKEKVYAAKIIGLIRISFN